MWLRHIKKNARMYLLSGLFLATLATFISYDIAAADDVNSDTRSLHSALFMVQ